MVIALLVLGPEKLPGAARQVGRIMAEFKRITGDVQSQVRDFIEEEPEADASRPAPTPTPEPAGPPVAGRPANAPDLGSQHQPEVPVVEPPRKHPGTEGFRLIDDASAPKPVTPTEPKPTDPNE